MRVTIVWSAGLLMALCLASGSVSNPKSSVLAVSEEAQTRPNSFCRNDETIVFNCRVKNNAKIISLCRSNDFGANQGYIQYRFGKPDKVELEYPSDHNGTQKLFLYAHYFRAQVDETEISFKNGNYSYTIFDYYENDIKPMIESQGITVTGDKEFSQEYKCATRAKADYSVVGEVLPCNPNSSFLPPGGCP